MTNQSNKRVIVVGAGAAGIMAAIIAARDGAKVTLLEKNNRIGKKLFITGKGRCNITNACEVEELFQYVVSNPKFLYGAFYSFTNQDVIDFFEGIGLSTKIERGNRVFPTSDKSSDVIAVLLRELDRVNVDVRLETVVKKVNVKDGVFKSVTCGNGTVIEADKVIVATGGLSYHLTGSTGDGYEFAKNMGHVVTKLSPSLVPINLVESHIVKELQGLSLKNIKVLIKSGSKEIYDDFGEMIFTHYGVSGPVILSSSSYMIPHMKNKDLTLTIDLKPALTFEQLDGRILRDFDEFSNKQFKNALDQLLPRKIIPIIISLSKINPDKKVNLITKEERQGLVRLLKGFEFKVASLRDYNEAVITRGGINVKEINPSTMESKLISGVYYIGEVLDLDALTGGFNLQIAWSTAYIAGKAVID